MNFDYVSISTLRLYSFYSFTRCTLCIMCTLLIFFSLRFVVIVSWSFTYNIPIMEIKKKKNNNNNNKLWRLVPNLWRCKIYRWNTNIKRIMEKISPINFCFSSFFLILHMVVVVAAIVAFGLNFFHFFF